MGKPFQLYEHRHYLSLWKTQYYTRQYNITLFAETTIFYLEKTGKQSSFCFEKLF